MAKYHRKKKHFGLRCEKVGLTVPCVDAPCRTDDYAKDDGNEDALRTLYRDVFSFRNRIHIDRSRFVIRIQWITVKCSSPPSLASSSIHVSNLLLLLLFLAVETKSVLLTEEMPFLPKRGK